MSLRFANIQTKTRESLQVPFQAGKLAITDNEGPIKGPIVIKTANLLGVSGGF